MRDVIEPQTREAADEVKSCLEVLLTLMLGAQLGPVFVIGMPPGEGIPSFFAKGPELVIYETPSTAGLVVGRFELSEGTELKYLETEYQTITGGLLVAQTDAVVDGRNLSTRRSLSRDDYYGSGVGYSEASVQAGDTVMYLQYRAEGTCFVLIHNDLWDTASCPASRQGVFVALSEPEVQWWIRTVEGPVAAGWLRVDDTTLRVRRSF